MSKLVPKDHGEEVALFRSQIIGAIAQREYSHGELAEALRELSQQRFRPPKLKHSRTFSVSTLERWYYDYRKEGMQGLLPKGRKDRGHGRKLSPEQLELLCDIRQEHPGASAELIQRTLVQHGRLEKEVLTASTLRRVYKDKGLDSRTLKNKPEQRQRLRWQAEQPGALWHGDVCHGPTLRDGAVRIHALLDDTSRYIVAIEAHPTEQEQDMLNLLSRALLRHGAPDALYLDNGATYRGEGLRLGCERLGITLLHARPYDPQARGKMERFWRTLRQGCLEYLSHCDTMQQVNERLWAFVERHYQRVPHGGLMGRTPAEVYEPSAHQATRLSQAQIEQALTAKERRRVNRDCTLSVDGVVWEVDQGYLAGRVVTVLRCLLQDSGPPMVEYEGQRLMLYKVDPVRNGKRQRTLVAPAQVATDKTSVSFDPVGTLPCCSPQGAQGGDPC